MTKNDDATPAPMTALRYAMNQSGFKAAEWTKLDKETKDGLIQYAREEMKVLGLPIKNVVSKA